jgi:ComF family protein
MSNFPRKIRGFILDILFPIECLNCQLEGAYLCKKCFRQIKFNDSFDLKRAQQNLKAPDLEKIFIAGNYEDKLLQNLIKKYKYGFIKPLGEILARFLITFWNFQNDSKNKIPVSLLVIPIPLTDKRLRWRGFNQAEILAREFSHHFNYGISLNLKRQGKQAPQAKLNEAERLNNIQGVFSWTGENLQGADVLLIDDVVTTGATLNEAARILKGVGAGAIYALVLAKG